MNWIHHKLCASNWWRTAVQSKLIPWATRNADLGSHPLEIGPGPGMTTEVLRTRCAHLTCLEIDPELASALEQRFRGGNVTVQQGDAAAMPFADNTFSGAACFTMLHHVPSVELQDRLLKEALRVLRPGAWLVGSDSRISLLFRMLHLGDTMVVCDPDRFVNRLSRAGFVDASVSKAERTFAFRGRKPERA